MVETRWLSGVTGEKTTARIDNYLKPDYSFVLAVPFSRTDYSVIPGERRILSLLLFISQRSCPEAIDPVFEFIREQSFWLI